MVLFLADECVSDFIVDDLRVRGFDVNQAKDVAPGNADDDVLAMAASMGRVIITDDRGFGELAIRHAQEARGGSC